MSQEASVANSPSTSSSGVTSETSASSRRNPWFAAALSLMAVGVGHVYCGRIAIGLALFGLWVLHLPMMAILAWVEPSRAAVLLLGVAPASLHFLLYFGAAIHAFVLATKSSPYVLRDYNRTPVYVALVFIGLTYPLLVAVTVRDNLFEAFVVPTNSMAPTIVRGERVLCNRARYLSNPIERGDLVVFKPPGEGPTMKYVKRVVAIAGDEVRIEKGRVILNGQPLEYQPGGDAAAKAIVEGLSAGSQLVEESLAGHRYPIGLGDNTIGDGQPLKISEGQLFVLGDLRPMSKDSRIFGPIDASQVIGRIEYCYFPSVWSRFGVVR